MEELKRERQAIEDKIFQYSLALLEPWYTKRQQIAKELPKFWQQAIERSELLGEHISYEDNEIFDHLAELNVEWDKRNPKIYTISFEFTDNKYMEACKLEKPLNGETMESQKVEIPWKKDMNLLELKNGDPSFFNWFEQTDESSFELGQTIAEELFPHMLDFYELEEGHDEPAEYDISESD